MKILFTTSKINNLHQVVELFENNELLFGDSFFENFPSEKSISFAHELLSFCLDNSIEKVYAARPNELLSLSEAKVLFAEFEIEIIIPNLNQNFIVDNFISEAIDFANLSSKLLSAGYPSQKLVIGKADLKGDLITIDDKVKDFNQVFTKVESLTFLQLGKLFNQATFEPIHVYQISNELKEVCVLHENAQTYILGHINPNLSLVIDLMLKQNNCLGFYQIYYNDLQITRLKNMAL